MSAKFLSVFSVINEYMWETLGGYVNTPITFQTAAVWGVSVFPESGITGA